MAGGFGRGTKAILNPRPKAKKRKRQSAYFRGDPHLDDDLRKGASLRMLSPRSR